MGRRRKKHKHLPPRVTYKSGAHYFTPFINGKVKYIWLGRSPNPDVMSEEATLAWRSLTMNDDSEGHTMDQVFDHYIREVLPKHKKNTQTSYKYWLKNLRAVFGHMRAINVKPSHIYKYQYMRSKAAGVSANREIAVLSSCFVSAIQKGWLEDNPCRLVKRLPEKPRDRYVKDGEFRAVYSIANVTVRCAMMIAYQTTQRRADVLNIKMSDLTLEGIYVKQGKRGKKLLIKWNEALWESVYTLAKYRAHLNSECLFVAARSRKKMTEDGFSTLWQKTITKALELKLINERFTFHDFKAKSVSDDKSGQESKRAGHGSPEITERVYNRGFRVLDALVRPTDILSVVPEKEVA